MKQWYGGALGLGISWASWACSGTPADAGADGGTDAGADAGAGGTDGGSSGGSGADGDGSGGSASPGSPSSGCGQSSTEALEQWLEKTTEVEGKARTYQVRLPANYDPERAYPVVYEFHGCSPQRETNNVPVENEAGDTALFVRGRALTDCWDDPTDLGFFDAMVEEVESTYCADTTRRFATGYSSGSFLSHQLSCQRADVLRAVATIAGGYARNDCGGPIAALLIHDVDDGLVSIDGSRGVRDQLIERNGCEDTSTAQEPSPCQSYTGCDDGYPLVWCETTGKGHDRQDALAAPAFWDFLSQF